MDAQPKLIFVTGKGGTGKSTVAAALALQQQWLGKRVQLIELGNRSFYGQTEPGQSRQVPALLDDIALFQLDPMQSLKQYVRRFALFESAADMLLDYRTGTQCTQHLAGA